MSPPVHRTRTDGSADVRERAGGVTRGNLGAGVSTFVGRRAELTELRKQLRAYRLVTLTGIGGVGKTRLAQQVGHALRRDFPDGVWFVGLADVRVPEPPARPALEPEVLAHAVAADLGLREKSADPPLEALAGYLADRCLLLLLDNCEHVLPACATLATTLLRRCPDVRILATSREPLAIAGEMARPVDPLRLPPPAGDPGPGGFGPGDLGPGDPGPGDPGPGDSGPGDFGRYESVAMFVERATAAASGFRLTAGNQDAVAEICRRVEGLPLAIELAAVLVRALTPAQILERVDDRFRLLNRGSRVAPGRQQTLRGCVDWSYDLCWKDEQRLWARLSVFAGGFDLDAAETVCAGEDLVTEDILPLTASLVDKSILASQTRGPAARYRMLETIRQYGEEKLVEAGDRAVIRRRHRDWCERLVTEANQEWISGRQAYWLDRLGLEHANLRAAVELCLAEGATEPAEAERGLDIVLKLPALYWWGRGRFGEGRRWLVRALALAPAPTGRRAWALLLAGRFAVAQGDGPASRRLLEQGESLARRLGDAEAVAHATAIRGIGALFRNDLRTAIDLLERALAGPASPAWLDHRLQMMFTLVAAAGLAGDERRATTWYAEVEAVTEPRGEVLHRSNAMWARGLAVWRRGDLDGAAALQRSSLALKRAERLDDPLGTALALEALAWIAAGQGRHRRAVALLAAAGARLDELGTPIQLYRHLVEDHDACERAARTGIGAAEFAAAWQEGQGLADPDALDFALDGRKPRPRAGANQPEATPLTRREKEVADLVARGLSNKDIARSLVISQRTAESHVENILTKLGFRSRTQVAAWKTRLAAGGEP